MTWISSAELTVMRAILANTLPDTAVIQSSTLSSDGEGGGTIAWSAVTSGTVACRLDPVSSSAAYDAVVAGKESLRVLRQLTVPHDAPLALNRRVVVGSQTYEVVSLADDNSWRIDRRAILAEVR